VKLLKRTAKGREISAHFRQKPLDFRPILCILERKREQNSEEAAEGRQKFDILVQNDDNRTLLAKRKEKKDITGRLAKRKDNKRTFDLKGRPSQKRDCPFRKSTDGHPDPGG